MEKVHVVPISPVIRVVSDDAWITRDIFPNNFSIVVRALNTVLTKDKEIDYRFSIEGTSGGISSKKMFHCIGLYSNRVVDEHYTRYFGFSLEGTDKGDTVELIKYGNTEKNKFVHTFRMEETDLGTVVNEDDIVAFITILKENVPIVVAAYKELCKYFCVQLFHEIVIQDPHPNTYKSYYMINYNFDGTWQVKGILSGYVVPADKSMSTKIQDIIDTILALDTRVIKS